MDATLAVRSAEVVFLATPFQANELALKNVAVELAGKVLVDCTNSGGPGLTHSLMSSAYPGYHVEPAMLFCGNDAAAKATVAALSIQLGWEPHGMGSASPGEITRPA